MFKNIFKRKPRKAKECDVVVEHLPDGATTSSLPNYIIVSSGSISLLQEEVNNKILLGYVCVGGMSAETMEYEELNIGMNFREEYTLYYQAMEIRV